MKRFGRNTKKRYQQEIDRLQSKIELLESEIAYRSKLQADQKNELEEKYLSKVTGLSFGQSSNSCQSALKELATDINYKDCTGVHHANRDDHE